MKPLVKDADCDVVICVPYVDLQTALEKTAGTNIKVGAENCHWAESGAFTGEVSAKMLTSMGINYVVIGHSERRTYFGDTDVTVKDRVRAALDAGMTVILCVGEYLEQRQQGVTFEVVGSQTKIALQGVTKEELSRIIIAYEPVWAIGTGLTATQSDSVIGEYSRLSTASVISEGAKVGNMCYIGTKSVVEDFALVPDKTVVEDASTWIS